MTKTKFFNYYFYQILSILVSAAPQALSVPCYEPQPLDVYVGECSSLQRRDGLGTVPMLMLHVWSTLGSPQWILDFYGLPSFTGNI